MGAVAGEPHLPSVYDLLHQFSLFNSSASSDCDVQIGANGSVFCKCKGCLRWRDFVEGRDASDTEVKYEVFTREYVGGLACYLRAKAAEYELSVMDVLEVGAGSGRLSQHLNESLSGLLHKNQGPVVRVVATDSGARGLNGPAVKEEDAIHAITTRKPHVIVSSWMPRGIDWTAHMRAEQSVREYILIGETDNGICGCPWQTWGFSSAYEWSDSDDSDTGDSKNSDLQSQADVVDCRGDGVSAELQIDPQAVEAHPEVSLRSSRLIIDSEVLVKTLPTDQRSVASSGSSQPGRKGREKAQYERDGWERVELENLSRLQLCRTDERWSTSRHSHTVSFRKK